jgi:hypothetical protein
VLIRFTRTPGGVAIQSRLALLVGGAPAAVKDQHGVSAIIRYQLAGQCTMQPVRTLIRLLCRLSPKDKGVSCLTVPPPDPTPPISTLLPTTLTDFYSSLLICRVRGCIYIRLPRFRWYCRKWRSMCSATDSFHLQPTGWFFVSKPLVHFSNRHHQIFHKPSYFEAFGIVTSSIWSSLFSYRSSLVLLLLPIPSEQKSLPVIRSRSIPQRFVTLQHLSVYY